MSRLLILFLYFYFFFFEKSLQTIYLEHRLKRGSSKMLLENSDCKMIEVDCKQRLSADVSIHYTMRLRTRVPLLITLGHVAMRTSAQKH